MLCICGASCEGCSYSGECEGGCEARQGKVFWTQYIDEEVCPIYRCAKEAGFKNCGDCAKLPCTLWSAVKDPAMSDEEHQKSITGRVAKLKAACEPTRM